MRKWKMAVSLASALLCVSAASGANSPNTDDLSGAAMYGNYCASCHGTDGRGAGPAAAALKKAVPDLTLISRRSGGQFPAFRVTHIIDGFEIQAAHGNREMPIWGDYFRDRKRDETVLQLREHNLTEYIRSIQQK